MVASALLSVAPLCASASPGSLDTSFDPGLGVQDGPVLGMAVQGDGKLIFGGYFFQVNGTRSAGVTRMLVDGTLDGSFHAPEVSGHLHAVLALPDGRILIGGEFNSVSGLPWIDLARLNRDGSLDSSFSAGESSGAGHVDALALQPDGKIVVAGDFRTFNRSAQQGVVRLLSNGGLDPTFNAGDGLVGHIPALALDGTKILIGGGFTNCQGATRYGITRLNADGSLDTLFQPNPGVRLGSGAGLVNSLTVQPDGKIVVGGNFSQVNGVPCNRIARLNGDGTFDLTFNPGSGVEGDASASVSSLALESDGKLLIAGWFSTVAGQLVRSVARLNRDGKFDPTFDPGTSVNDLIKVITMTPQGHVLLGGYFTQYNGVAVSRIACLQGDFRPATASPIRLWSDPGSPNNQFAFEVVGTPGSSFTIEYSEDLRVWRTLTNFISRETSTPVLDSATRGVSLRFYRALSPL